MKARPEIAAKDPKADLEALARAFAALREPEQVEAFLALEGVSYILLDNMSTADLVRAVEMRGERTTPLLEASGGVTLTTVAGIAESGVDFISVGAITHSVKAMDLALDFIKRD